MDSRSGHGQHVFHHANTQQYGGSKSTPSLPLSQYEYGPLQRQSSYSLTEGFSSSGRDTEFIPDSSAPSGNFSTRKQGKTTKRTTKKSQQHARATAFRPEQTALGQESREGKEGGQEQADYISPVQEDFEADPAHAFWTWSVQEQNWYHQDSTTGAILWAPLELD
ncbi:hypothetical protein CPLU01_01244 [Colletotrichum plurivorum]|uniref:Uncharacterized protein n=1 Tax=Colletotrichum plurivorum TaxID=2175906 RepID=A0A8H6NPK4_9PEZI|nr:hypothetical protein CPLU01_01244 [Colletotrichum plurivorum]